MYYCYLDFETTSEVDISKVGAYLYANDASTFIQCLGLAWFAAAGNFIKHLWLPDGNHSHNLNAVLMEKAADPSCIFVAWNAFFDRNIWTAKMVPLGYPNVPIHRWKDPMAKALALGLPGGLDDCCKALGIEGKDKAGADIMRQLSKPRRQTKDNKEKFWTPKTAARGFERLYEYCLQDIDSMVEADKIMPDLSVREQRIWCIDQRINQEGVQLDLPLVNRMRQFRDDNEAALLSEFKELTRGSCSSPKQTKRFLAFLQSNNVAVKNVRASTLRKVQGNEIANRAIEIRQELGKTSPAKLETMVTRSDENGRLRELFQYHGAHTGRWAGRGVQLQNLKRSPANMEQIINDIFEYDSDDFAWLYGDVNSPLSGAIRGCIIPSIDVPKRLVLADFAQMEARILAWLAGDKNKLDLFATGHDLYLVAASAIYGREIAKEDKDERQVGKVSELALSYEGGIGAYANMAKGYDVNLSPLFNIIWPMATSKEKEKAVYSYQIYLKKFLTLQKQGKLKDDEPAAKDAAYASDIIKQRWRRANPHIVEYWRLLQDTLIEHLRTGYPQLVTNGCVWFTKDRWTFLRLPSGRLQSYPSIKLGEDGKPSYMGKDPTTGRRAKVGLYGGKLAENITQAVQRDLLSEAMDRLEKVYPTYFHVHDEIVAEMPIDATEEDLEEFKKIMVTGRKWTAGIPVDASCEFAARYKK